MLRRETARRPRREQRPPTGGARGTVVRFAGEDHLRLVVVVFTLATSLAPAAALADGCPQAFVELGGSAHDAGVSNRSVSVLCQRVAVDRQGTPFALWADTSSGKREVYLRRWDGEAWVGLDGSDVDGGLSGGRGAVGMGLSCLGQLKFDSQNRPVAVWMNYDGTLQSTFVARFNGTRWEELGGSMTAGGLSGTQLRAWYPTLTIDALDELTVAWTSANRLYARRWNGSAWVQLAGSATAPGLGGTGSSVTEQSAATGANGHDVIAWEDVRAAPAPREVYVRRWDGSAWTGLGTSGEDGGLGQGAKPSVVLDELERPIVAWESAAGDGGLVIRGARWDGTAWAPLEPATLVGGKPILSLSPTGALFVVYETPENTVRLARWSGSGWENCPTGLQDTGRSSWPAMQIGPDGRFVIGWFEQVSPGNLQSYLVRSQPPTPPPPAKVLDVGCACSSPGELPFVVLLIGLLRARRRGRRRA